MVRKNRIGIEQDVIFLPLPAVETYESLFRETVAEKARTGSNRRLVQFGCRRNHPGRIMLQHHIQTSYVQTSGLHPLQSPEIGTSHRPVR